MVIQFGRQWVVRGLGLVLLLLVMLGVQPVYSAVGMNAQTDNEAVARLIVFHSPTCPHCRTVLNEVLPPIQARYGAQLEIQFYDVSEPEGYGVFAALHEAYPDLPGGVPQGYIRDRILVGSLDFETGLVPLIDTCLAEGGCDWAFTFQSAAEVETAENTDTAYGPTQPVYLAYCYDPSCADCNRVKYDLQHLQDTYPNLVVREFHIQHDAVLIEAMCERYEVPEDQRLIAPAIFVGGAYLPPDDISVARLQALIEGAGEAGQPWANLEEAALEGATGRIMDRFAQFNVLTIMLAGLLDGVNPCAFTTMIFFVSYLALVGRKGREVLLVGAAFTLAVFLTYIALGMGISTFVEQIQGFRLTGIFIYGLTALICFVLAFFSAWDYIKIRRGELTDIALQLPGFLKKRIHATIRKHSRMEGYVGAAFVAGILVSVFELACTGQVYLPTIVFMTGLEDMRFSAFLYLVLYNLMFVIPLIAVFLVTYFGTSNQQLTVFFQANAAWVKLATVLLFLVLGGWLVGMLWLSYI